ncbi:uncharacterized protein LOC107639368 isoform X2 [Arachis ipaensis]|uniref:uncharacterized protein LOC107639368 isoform X2 n=1 Tax=Arachis ipaensis TaxID=130454 RepID=UPI000A2B226F|nr:uncharacterized protein LOC107639368 isoform X2 [Arachis ipaensis]
MSTSVFIHNFCLLPSCSPNCSQNRNLAYTPLRFHSPNSNLKLNKKSFPFNTHFKISTAQKPRSSFVVFAAQSNFLRVLQTAWNVGRDGIEAGANLVPNSVPRPIARISVGTVALTLLLFVLKSVLSTVFFALRIIMHGSINSNMMCRICLHVHLGLQFHCLSRILNENKTKNLLHRDA